MEVRSYSELITISSFKDRFEYLRLNGSVGLETFGFDRYLNQRFYHSTEWQTRRDKIIVRDCGCDLGVEGREICGRIYIHHMNPMLVKDLTEHFNEALLDPEYLICASHNTHNAIHYGDENLLMHDPVERRPNDTCPWRKEEQDAKYTDHNQETDRHRRSGREF